jgi:hypothetical protein
MGINYSKVICADEKNLCRYGEAIPQKIYMDNIAGKKPEEIQKYVCQQNLGAPRECCDPLDPAAAEVVKEKTNLVKVVLDKNGKYTEFQVCQCPLDDGACISTHCKADFGFKQPTQYEKCRARAIKDSDKIEVSPYVYKVLAANTYSNCYSVCK